MAIPVGTFDKCPNCCLGPFCGPDSECEYAGNGTPASLAAVLKRDGYPRITLGENKSGCTCDGEGGCAHCLNKEAGGTPHNDPHPGASHQDGTNDGLGASINFEHGRLPGCMPPRPDRFDRRLPVDLPFGQSNGICRLHPSASGAIARNVGDDNPATGNRLVKRKGIPPTGGVFLNTTPRETEDGPVPPPYCSAED